MHIEINGDAERVIEAGLLSGEFGSAEEAVAAMAKVWADRKDAAPTKITAFPSSTNIDALAAEQGARPFDPTSPPPDFWPAEDSVDDFVGFLREVRKDANRREDLAE